MPDKAAAAAVVPASDLQKYLEAMPEGGKRAEYLRGQLPHTLIEWERQISSSHSPGVVRDDEQVCRYWLNPVHYDEAKGELKPTAVDDANTWGMSCNRLEHTTLDAVRGKAVESALTWNQAHPDGPERRLIGYSIFAAQEVREAVNDKGARLAIVIDTALRTDRSHADVCVIEGGQQARRSFRAQLWKKLNSRVQSFG